MSAHKYARVTFLDPDGKRAKFFGRFSQVQPGVFRGERRADVRHTKETRAAGIEFPQALHLLIIHRDEILKVERENPIYGDGVFEKAPDGFLDEIEVPV